MFIQWLEVRAFKYKAALMTFVVHDTRDGSMWSRNCYSPALLLFYCLPDVTMTKHVFNISLG